MKTEHDTAGAIMGRANLQAGAGNILRRHELAAHGDASPPPRELALAADHLQQLRLPVRPHQVHQRLEDVSVEDCIVVGLPPALGVFEHVQPRLLQRGNLALPDVGARALEDQDRVERAPRPLGRHHRMRQRRALLLRPPGARAGHVVLGDLARGDG